MAEEASASLILRARTSAFRRAMKSVNSVMVKVRNRMQAAASAAKRILVVGGAALGLMTRAAIRQEQAELMLDAALKTTGQSADVYGAKLRKAASEIQNLTTQGDEATLELMAMGLNLGVTADQLEDTTRMALGLAKALGQDSKAGMRNYALAMQGNFLMLARYIPAVRAATTEQGKLNAVNKIAAAGFKQLQAEAETTGGRITQLWNTIGDLSEKIGDVFLPKTKEFAERLKPIIEGTQQWVVENKIFIAESVGLVAKMGLVVVAMHGVVAAMTLITAHPFVAVIAGMVLAFAGLRQSINDSVEAAHKMPEITKSAKRALREMEEAQKKATAATKAAELADEQAATAKEKSGKRITKFIEEFQNEVDMFGLSAREIAAYKISLEGLSQEEDNQIWMLTKSIEMKEQAVEATKKLKEAEKERADELQSHIESQNNFRDAMSAVARSLGVAEGWLSKHQAVVERISQQYSVTLNQAEQYVNAQKRIVELTKKEKKERQEMSRIESADALYNRIATAAATKRKASDALSGTGSSSSRLPSPSFEQDTAEKLDRGTFRETIETLLRAIEAKLPVAGVLG